MAEKVITLGFTANDNQYIIREVNEDEFVQFYMKHFMKLNELGVTPMRRNLIKAAAWLVTLAARATFRSINRQKGGQTRGFSGQQGGLRDLL